jgi:DNA-binding CsgD family transcriptional regulator
MSPSNITPLAALKPMIDEIHTLIRHCGKAEFPRILVSFLRRLANVDHLSIFIFDHQLIPRLVVAESAGPDNLAKKAGKAYENAYLYRHDPNTTQVKVGQGSSSGPLLVRLRADQICDPEYRDNIYRRFKLLDRLSLIDHLNGRWIVTNFYRDIESGEFSGEDISVVQQLASLVSAILEKNFALLPSAVWQATTRPSEEMLENILVSLNASLSQREIEVCARALLGMTSNGIGLELGIQTSTVATLRKRAYTKLNISGLSELFSLCLGKAMVVG